MMDVGAQKPVNAGAAKWGEPETRDTLVGGEAHRSLAGAPRGSAEMGRRSVRLAGGAVERRGPGEAGARALPGEW